MRLRGVSEHRNAVAVAALAGLVVLLGGLEVARPFGLGLAELTAGLIGLDTLIRIGILTIVVIGLNLVMGYAGQISLGQAAFYGLGAYVSAILTTLPFRQRLLPVVAETWWWPWLALVAGMGLTGGFAYLIGRPILRLRGHYLAMATLGLGSVMYVLFREGGALTGGNDGLPGIPRLAIGGWSVWPMERYYFLVWGGALLVIIVALNIVNSRVGRALRAIHSSELAANSLGVDTSHYKLQVLVVSAMMASLAGSLYAHFQALVAPSPFDFVASVELVIMAAVGGLNSVWGAPLGVTLILVVREILRARLETVLHLTSGGYELIAYGLILILVMIFMPEGLTPALTRAYRGGRAAWLARSRGRAR
jgi:branched-chain amino acid transport system permease protein